MPKPLPFPARRKDVPESDLKQQITPENSKPVETVPEQTDAKQTTPVKSLPKIEQPEKTGEVEVVPEESNPKEDMPSGLIDENCVKIGEEIREIKPTKLKYFRNKAASGYSIIKAVPIQELLTYDKGVLDAERDADHLLFDFLVAAFDDVAFVKKNYDNMTAEDVERVVRIFGRLNHIDEKEEQARKNREAQAKR